MRSVVYTKVSTLDALQVEEREMPSIREDEVLVEVRASALNNSDTMKFLEDSKGKIPTKTHIMMAVTGAVGKAAGAEVSGIVEKVGKSVTHFKAGDEVYASLGTTGAWSEYVAVKESVLCLKPKNLSFEEAAAIPVSGITALGAVRKANIEPGQQVLVYGASGGVGHYAVQLAKAQGAIVTAVCSTRNIEMAHTIGADFVIDYTTQNFANQGKTYDAIIAVNGYNPLGVYTKALNDGGTYVVLGGMKQAMSGILGPIRSIGSSKKLTFFIYASSDGQESLIYLKKLAEAGELKPYIDKSFSVWEAGDAIKYAIDNHAHGKISLTFDS